MILLILPHQLFLEHPGLDRAPDQIVLLEDSLFFGDHRYPARFHKQKLWLHRATMKRYEAELRGKGFDVCYVDYAPGVEVAEQIRRAADLKTLSSDTLACMDPTDFVMTKRLRRASNELGLQLELLSNPGFINSPEQNREYRESKNAWAMSEFYKWQRRRMNLLMTDGKPTGGQWSFDTANRKKVPKKALSQIPVNLPLVRDAVDEEAKEYVEARFGDNPGSLRELHYPTTHRDAAQWLAHFLSVRFDKFGDFEDAIVEGESWLWHSVLTPSLNVGLLTPDQVLKATLQYAASNDVPINSLEGFVRQIVGWREFMRATYEDLGVAMRTTNHWQHHRPLPKCFYDGSTGIAPIDDTIRRILETGYCHHIERLMVLGGFMFLCEIDPDDIYRWFMEMFIDSYDWVMVPNVYAMSQNADGGMITTKPYFSGSAYIRKMSHHKEAEWSEIWDGLYWRWIWNHTDQLGKNPRWAMMCSMAKKMDDAKRERHLQTAKAFLDSLN